MKLRSLVPARAGALASLIASLIARLIAGVLASVLIITSAPLAGAASAPSPGQRWALRAAAVAPGSYLTTVERGPGTSDGGIRARREWLVLVGPTGDTRTVYVRKVTRKAGYFQLADWSADGSTALLLVDGPHGSRPVVVDVAAGTATTLHVERLSSAVLDPSGTGILAAVWKGNHSNKQVLERIAWTGAVTVLMESTNGNIAPAPNGTVLTQDADRPHVQLLLSISTGAVVHEFRHRGYCTPVRWWDATRLLEMCGRNLFLVDPTTGRFDQLTSGHGRGDYGHLDARYVGSRLYVQVAGACGYTYVAKVTRKGTKHLKVPGAVGNVLMVNAVGNDLILEHAASCDGARPRSMLTRFDPVTHDETPMLVLEKREAFGRIMLLGEVYASVY
ncbi:MAG TPA: hypothetical protein VFV89_19555 [Nocardioides sp.]|uniref:hypothetical protein n=1 Tax=Nocardioides sp. TaxID=35761 RepID=UPI002E312A96|nr:hypothetical protein [Nocardioides sp.]HEX5090014.1 hypothetical protein [Nocardioides sp.]